MRQMKWLKAANENQIIKRILHNKYANPNFDNNMMLSDTRKCHPQPAWYQLIIVFAR